MVAPLPDSDSDNDNDVYYDFTPGDDVTGDDDMAAESDRLMIGVPEYFTTNTTSHRKVDICFMVRFKELKTVTYLFTYLFRVENRTEQERKIRYQGRVNFQLLAQIGPVEIVIITLGNPGESNLIRMN